MAIKKRISYTSKGERHSVALKVMRLMRANKPSFDKWLDKQRAWSLGQNPWLSIDNPNTNETNKKQIRVRANNYWGNPFPKKEKLPA